MSQLSAFQYPPRAAGRFLPALRTAATRSSMWALVRSVEERMDMIRAVAFAALAGAWAVTGSAAPAAGDAYVYLMVNGYSKEPRGQLHYQVEKVDATTYTVTVSPDKAAAGWQRTEIYTKEGNGLLQLMETHGEKVDYLFAQAY